ncbi:unnamed protein product [Pleuronectes platessa]|uniref:Uncharacterized protein n=1 Tax=Pleuronectes platessa TaxID=8262 RepID=A0A9N7VVL3_PLEPL|nr:unnamed protein product [Pleuronectes platessa]
MVDAGVYVHVYVFNHVPLALGLHLSATATVVIVSSSLPAPARPAPPGGAYGSSDLMSRQLEMSKVCEVWICGRLADSPSPASRQPASPPELNGVFSPGDMPSK